MEGEGETELDFEVNMIKTFFFKKNLILCLCSAAVGIRLNATNQKGVTAYSGREGERVRLSSESITELPGLDICLPDAEMM